MQSWFIHQPLWLDTLIIRKIDIEKEKEIKKLKRAHNKKLKK